MTTTRRNSSRRTSRPGWPTREEAPKLRSPPVLPVPDDPEIPVPPLERPRPRSLPGPPVSAASPFLRDATNRLAFADDADAPRGPGAAASRGGVELAVEAPPRPRFATLQVRHEDKAVFDALAGWWALSTGRRPTQWELFTVVLSQALERGDVRPAFAA